MQITPDRIRLAVDQTNKSGVVVDALTGSAPSFYAGNDVQFELAFFTAQLAALLDLSNVDQVRLQVKPLANRDALAVLDDTVASGSLNNSLTLAQWNSGDPAQEHCLVSFANTLTNLDLQGQTSLGFWLVVSVLTGSGDQVTVATGQVTVVDSGFNTAAPSLVQTPTYYTAAQSDARYGSLSGALYVAKTGATMSGSLLFSGTANPGVVLSNLTTTQRTGLTAAAGMAVYDTTIGSPLFYMGGVWKQPVTSVNGATGVVVLTSDNVAQGSTNLYMTNAGVLAQPLTGLTGTYSAVTSADTVLSAFGKLAAFAAGGGGGTVTSVALSAPAALFTVSGSPLTSSGTLTLSLANQSANTVFAGPTTGGGATPTWRALVAADVPNIAESQVTNLVTDLAAKLPLAGGTMTGTLKLWGVAGASGEALIASPSSGMLIYDTTNGAPAFYNGSAWVLLSLASGGSYLPLGGGTLTGALNLVAGTPSGQNATSFAFTNATYAQLTGATFTGAVNFNTGGGAFGFTLPSVTTAQRTAMSGSAVPGTMVWDNQVLQPFVWNSTFWQNPYTAYGCVQITGSAMTGELSWATSATNVAGLTLNSLTTTQMNALSPTTGMFIYNVTASQPYFYNGSAWVSATAGSALPLAGGTMTGNIVFSGTIAGLVLSNLSTTNIGTLTGAAGMLVYNTTTNFLNYYNGSAWVALSTGASLGNKVQLTGSGPSLSGVAANMTAVLTDDANPTDSAFRLKLTFTSGTNVTGSLVTVTFNTAFSNKPKVVFAVHSLAYDGGFAIDYSTLSTTGFTLKTLTGINFNNTSGGPFDVDFVCIG